MNILKFGGSSVGSTERILKIVDIITQKHKKSKTTCIIFSAYQGVTDQLIKMGKLAAIADKNYLTLLDEIKQRHIDTATALLSVKFRKAALEEIKFGLNNLEEILYGVFLVMSVLIN